MTRFLNLWNSRTDAAAISLDTNVLSSLVRRPAGLRAKIAIVGDDALCTSVIVACELRFGALKKGSVELSARVDALLDSIAVLPLDARIDRVYAKIRHRLVRPVPIRARACARRLLFDLVVHPTRRRVQSLENGIGDGCGETGRQRRG